MDKESIYNLQLIDCCCNDCKFMVRDIERHKLSVEAHHIWQLDYFNTTKNNLIKKSKYWRGIKGDLEKWNDLLMEAESMKFQFNRNSAMINFGECDKFNKQVTFIPNICSMDNQDCFEHRKPIIITND